jgi:hypothetical protein
VVAELNYGPLTVPKDLIKPILSLQKSRTQMPTWLELLSDVKGVIANKGTPYEEERIATKDLITQWLKLTAAQMNSGTYKLIADSMRELGWSGGKIRFNDRVHNGYSRVIASRGVGSDNDQDADIGF